MAYGSFDATYTPLCKEPNVHVVANGYQSSYNADHSALPSALVCLFGINASKDFIHSEHYEHR